MLPSLYYKKIFFQTLHTPHNLLIFILVFILQNNFGNDENEQFHTDGTTPLMTPSSSFTFASVISDNGSIFDDFSGDGENEENGENTTPLMTEIIFSDIIPNGTLDGFPDIFDTPGNYF